MQIQFRSDYLQMSGYNEISDWIYDNYDFDPDDDPLAVFEQISRDFEKDNRLPLADILQEETPKMIKSIEDQINFTREFLVRVKEYTTKKGTVVKAHWRNRF